MTAVEMDTKYFTDGSNGLETLVSTIFRTEECFSPYSMPASELLSLGFRYSLQALSSQSFESVIIPFISTYDIMVCTPLPHKIVEWQVHAGSLSNFRNPT
jgi:hypothetical protein